MFAYLLFKECHRGTFGYDCVNTCHCLNISSCDKRTGTCDGGCTPGYIKNNCSTSKCYDQMYILKESETVSNGQEYNISERSS